MVWFLSFAVFWRSSILLRVGLCDKFSGANFCFSLSFCGLVFLVGFCLCFLRIFLQVRPGNALKKFSSCQVLFFLVRSLCLRVWVDDVFVVSLPSLFSFQRERSGLTGHHTPPRTCCWFFPFLFSVPAALVCSPVLAVRPFCSGVSLGCHSGPRAFFGFSRDFSDASFLDARRQRRLLDSFLWSFVFPVLWCLRLHTFLVGLGPAEGLRPPLVWFLLCC